MYEADNGIELKHINQQKKKKELKNLKPNFNDWLSVILCTVILHLEESPGEKTPQIVYYS